MSFTLDLWSLLIIITIAQGLFVLSMFLANKQWYRPPGVFLTSIIVVFIWLQAEFFSIRSSFDVRAPLFYGTRYGSWMLLGPLYFLYLRTSLQPRHSLKRGNLLHFLPFIIFVLVLPLSLRLDGMVSHFQVHYGMLTPFYPYKQEVTLFNYLYTAVFIFQFIHLGIYLLAGALLIQNYKSKFLEINSSMNRSILWLQGLNIALLAALLFVSTFLIIFFFTKIYRRHLDYLYVVPMAVILYLIAFRLMKVQLPDVAIPANTHDKRYEKSSLTKKQAKAYARRVESHLETEKPYLLNDLRLNDMATALGIPPYHLSQVINEEMGANFFDLINRLRVAEAQKLIRAWPDSSLLEIAHEAGFNNKTSFVNAFKKYVGKTPSGYRKMINSQN